MNHYFIISDLIVRKIEGRLSSEEELILNNWKEKNIENAELLERLLRSPQEDYLRKEEIRKTIDRARGWHNVKLKIRKRKMQKAGVKFLQIAAILVIVFGSIHLIIRNNHHHLNPDLASLNNNMPILITSDCKRYLLNDTINTFGTSSCFDNNIDHLLHSDKRFCNAVTHSNGFDTIVVPKGTNYHLVLMDGTKVWLNSNSKFSFPSKFNQQYRTVSLQGEAFLDIAPDSLSPFVISVNNIEIKVVGTEFNVNAYPSDNQVITTVVEGKVIVRNENYNIQEFVLPNEQLIASNTSDIIQKKNINPDVYTAWTKGRLVFENESLETLMERLSRIYDVKFIISDNVDKTQRITGDIRRYKDINRVLDLLAIIQNIKFQINGKTITVS